LYRSVHDQSVISPKSDVHSGFPHLDLKEATMDERAGGVAELGRTWRELSKPIPDAFDLTTSAGNLVIHVLNDKMLEVMVVSTEVRRNVIATHETIEGRVQLLIEWADTPGRPNWVVTEHELPARD